MATQFTPITTVSPTAVNDSGKIDKAISLVQGLLKQRQESADQKYTNTVRSKNLRDIADEDAQKQMTINQNNNFLALMQAPEKNFDTKLLQDKTLNGELSPEQAKALMPYANDYVSENDRVLAFAEGLKQIDTKDPVQLATLMTNTGVDETTARYYISNMNKGKATRGGSGGSGSGAGKTPPPEGQRDTIGEAKGINIKEIMRTRGMNFGNYNVTKYGTDLNPNVQLISNGKTYIKDSRGYYVQDKQDKKKGVLRRIKDNYLDTKIPKDVMESLNQGFETWWQAHLDSQGKMPTAVSGTFNASRWKQTNE